MQKIAKLIQAANDILITTHSNPDGDGLGSEMAIYLYLKSVGKKCRILNTHPTPAKFQLVDSAGVIEVYKKGTAIRKPGLVLVMDTGESKMLGVLDKPITELKVRTIYIDHHFPENPADKSFRESNLIDDTFGSTGELVFTLLEHLNATFTKDIAIAIYVAILTDTASFRFNRTTARSHEIAAQLLRLGISPEDIYQKIYARDSVAKIRLYGHVLENVQTSSDGRIAWLIVSRKMRRHFKATVEDTETFINQLTLVYGIDIGMLFREEDDGRIKVSLRGNNGIPVWEIAKKFSGGGHLYAAGTRTSGPLGDAILRVVAEAQRVLSELLAPARLAGRGAAVSARAPKTRSKSKPSRR